MSSSLTIAADEAAKLQQLVTDLVDHACRKGASQVEISAGIHRGYAVEIRLGAVDKLEYTHDHELSLTVYFDHHQGSAHTTDFSSTALEQALDKACNIARFTGSDPYAGLPEQAYLAFTYPDCDLYHPWDLLPPQAIELAKECEQIGLDYDQRITNSEGVALETNQGFQVLANSAGFIGSYHASRHYMNCVLLAESGQGMERDHNYTVARDPNLLESGYEVAKQAAEKTIARLNPQRIRTGKYPVLMQATVARSIFSHLLSAIQGGRLYRQTSFLLGSLGQLILPPEVTLQEVPHLAKAIGSAPFDLEGVRTQERALVKEGVLQSYCLNTYAARKLGMQPTGHAGGIHNIFCTANHLYTFPELLAKMQRGLLVTELMGDGVNLATGDYSRGAAGFWVEQGEIAYPVAEITIAGHLRDMFQHIVALGTDIDYRSSIITGSVLFDMMAVAGE